MLTIEARAKINWTLNITGRRADGYHELDMLMQSVELCDTVRLWDGENQDITLHAGNSPSGSENIAMRAARLLKTRLDIKRGVRIGIDKRIPMGAGLGGGSADAAAVLVGLNLIWELGMPTEQLAAIAVELGADVPFFLTGGLMRAGGIGERLVPLSSPDLYIAIAHPGIGLSTPNVYTRYDQEPAPESANIDGIIQQLANNIPPELLFNALEAPAFALLPEVARLKQAFIEAGARSCAMTGSGSAVFAAFSTEREAAEAVSQIKAPFTHVARTAKEALNIISS